MKTSAILTTALVALAELAPTADAWWANGHMLVGEVATQLMNATDVETIHSVLVKWEDDFPNTAEITTAAVWPDLLKCAKESSSCQTPALPSYSGMSDWHYLNLPLNVNGTEWEGKEADLALFDESLGGDAVSVLEGAMKSFKTTQSNWAANLMLRNFIHIFGDLHQPLHTVAGISDTLPRGDGGGNSYTFQSPPCAFSNLHAVWDAAGGVYSGNNWALNIDDFRPALNQNASDLISLLPTIPDALNLTQYADLSYADFYTTMVTDDVLREIVLDTYSYADSVVYSGLDLSVNASTGYYPCPSDEYMAEAASIAQLRIVTGGSRLAVILTQFASQLRALGLA